MTTPPIHSDMGCKDEFLEGAARCFFVMAYADYAEEEERREFDDHDYPMPGGGEDWYDYAPEVTPPAAYAAAGELWARLAILNKATAPCGVVSLLDQAAKANNLGCDVDAEHFGRDCAMMALGTGVSWFDDNNSFPLETPYMDCGSVTFAVEAYLEE